MTPPNLPLVGAKTEEIDFNNDGIADELWIGGYPLAPGVDVNDDYRTQPGLWPDVRPVLLGKPGLLPFHSPLVLPSGCAPPERREGVVPWMIGKYAYQNFRSAFLRFYNHDRTMFFGGRQQVAQRDGPALGMVEGMLILFNAAAGRQEAPVYAYFPKCRFAPIEDLVWVLSNGRRLDMQRAVRLAAGDAAMPLEAQRTAEGQVAAFLREMRGWVTAHKGETPEALRQQVVARAKAFPLHKVMPEGWETTVLFHLGLQESVMTTPPCLSPACAQQPTPNK